MECAKRIPFSIPSKRAIFFDGFFWRSTFLPEVIADENFMKCNILDNHSICCNFLTKLQLYGWYSSMFGSQESTSDSLNQAWRLRS